MYPLTIGMFLDVKTQALGVVDKDFDGELNFEESSLHASAGFRWVLVEVLDDPGSWLFFA